MDDAAAIGDAAVGVGVFAAAVRRLFVAAGSPTVAQVARRVGVSAGTVSHWRTGRHLPADFAVIEPMLSWLSEEAAHRNESGEPGTVVGASSLVLSAGQWRELFDAATRVDAAVPVLRAIAAMAEQWMTTTGGEGPDAEKPDVAGVRQVLLAGVGISSAGDFTLRVIDQQAVVQAHLDELVDALADLGVLSPTPAPTAPASAADSAAAGGGGVGWRLVDVRLIECWPRLQRWAAEAERELTLRSGLEHDARWWEQSGQPRAWLYSHVRLAVVAEALAELTPPSAAAAATGDAADAAPKRVVEGFRFGVASAGQVPVPALRFWAAAQRAATVRLRVDQIITGLIIVLIVMVLGLGFTLAWTTGTR